MTDETPTVVTSLEDDTGEHCVDILQHADGQFTYAEYIRDDDGWHLAEGDNSGVFKTQYAAYLAAVKTISWLIA